MDDFLRFKTFNEEYGQTWVVVPQPGSSQILAFYTIDPDPITGIADDEYNEYPVGLVTLQMLGVDEAYKGRRIGTRLLIRIIRQVLRVANAHSITGLALIALNQKASNWYIGRNFGFKASVSDSLLLILPLETMRLLSDEEEL